MKQLNIKKNTNARISQDAHELNLYACINDVRDWQDLMEIYQKLKQEHAPKKILLLLEDIGQCNYTSMHASMRDELYFDESKYMGDVEGEQEDIVLENIQPLAVQYYIQQLNKVENQVNFKKLHKKFEYSQEDFDLLIQIHKYPEAILDSAIEVKLVDVEQESEKFVAQLNGYFSCDLNPMESFTLIRHLHDQFGLEYLGLGASLLFFIKNDQFDPSNISNLLDDLSEIYTFNSDIFAYFTKHLAEQNYLILPYVESLNVFEGCFD